MVELTVGYVSGVIAAAVFFSESWLRRPLICSNWALLIFEAQLFVPLALALILVGILSEKHSAVSW